MRPDRPPGSFAADAHYCIMVRVLGPAEYRDAARSFRARHAGSPPIVIPTTASVPSCPKPSRPSLVAAAESNLSDRAAVLPAMDGFMAFASQVGP
jgi:hypothetical protein